jgi:hypothetical protein
MSARTTAVVSFFGDTYPEEMVADQMATFFLYERSTVTSYMCVGDFDRNSIFLANYRHDEEINNTEYVKKMVPNTAHLRNIDAQVLFLFCHGVERDKTSRNPSLLNFDGNDSVTIYGAKNPRLPHALTISSCRQYEHKGTTYTAPVNVFLSEVVGQTQLVMLLCCYGADIVQEYASEESDGSNRPNFVTFERKNVNVISIDFFLTLLMLSMDMCELTDDWNQVLELHVRQVMNWIESCKNRDELWDFLLENECLEELTEDLCRSKKSTQRLSKKEVGQYLYHDLQSLTLLRWQEGVYKAVESIDLADYIRQESAHAPQQVTGMHALLKQLEALTHGV